MSVSILYCGEKIVKLLNLSDVKLIVGYTGNNKTLASDKSIPFINSYILHEPFFDYEERKELLKEVMDKIATVTDGTIIVHCQFGQTRSRELAEVLSENFGYKLERAYLGYEDKLVRTDVIHTGNDTMHEFFNNMIKKIKSNQEPKE